MSTPLTVTNTIAQETDYEWIHFIWIQHILSDTVKFIDSLKKSNGIIWKIYAKPFSLNQEFFNEIKDSWTKIEVADYTKFDETDYLEKEVEKYCNTIKGTTEKIILLDVWWYFSKMLKETKSQTIKDYVIGVSEITRFWYNRYQNDKLDIDIPIYSVARSKIKEHEAKFVWKSSFLAVEKIFMDLGKTLYKRKALVLWYWMIWKNNAEALKNNDVNVSVYDPAIDDSEISTDYPTWKREELLRDNQIIFSWTATQAVSYDDMHNYCMDWVYLISTWSKWNEFDVKNLKSNSISEKKIHEHITEYTLDNWKKINLVRDGTAVNFLVWWTPDEIIDLVLAEYTMTIKEILDWKWELHTINEMWEKEHNRINKIFKENRS